MSEVRYTIFFLLLIWCAINATYQSVGLMQVERSCVSTLKAIDAALKDRANETPSPY